MQLCERVAKDGGKYREYTDHVFDRKTREELVNFLQTQSGESHSEDVTTYLKEMKSIPAFNPIDIIDFSERYIDFTPLEVRNFWNVFSKVTRKSDD